MLEIQKLQPSWLSKFSISPLKRSFLLIAASTLMSACGGSSGGSEQTPEPEPVEQGTYLSEFAFLTSDNPELTQNVYLTLVDSKYSGRIADNVSVASLVPSFEHDGELVEVNNVEHLSGESPNDFTQVVTYTVKTNDGRAQSYQVDVTKFTGLPVIYLSTEDSQPIDSKEDYVKGAVAIDGGRLFTSQPDTEMKIRGRGNSTWAHPKKPFQMKLSDKGEFLGMPAEKKWLFLAEYSDKTLLRNTIAFELGHISNLDWTPKSEFAEVYINDEYNGTYNITEKVEESENRVVIGDTGYLLEIDQPDRLDPDDVYFNTSKFLINIKSPETSFGSSEYNYVEGLFNDFESALYGDDFKDPEQGYAKFIDLDSFVDWYLISEITKNVDSQWFSSIYINVMPGEKIKMGPLWDFDLAFGNVDYADSRYAEGWWIKYNPWYQRLFQDPAFVSKVKERFDYFETNQDVILDKLDAHALKLDWAQQENDDKWQTIGTYVWPNPVVLDTYEAEVEHLKDWYNRRMSWLGQALDAL